MPEIVAWETGQAKAIIDRAVELLRAGQLVAFPTETVYKVACGLTPDAVQRMLASCGSPRSLALAVTGETQALDWAPGLNVFGRRLARRCWPGPVTLAARPDLERGAAARLPDAVRDVVAADNWVRLRCPDHDAVLETLLRLEGPVLLGDAGPPATSSYQVAKQADAAVALVIDDEDSQDERDATVVQVDGSSWQVVQEGAAMENDLAWFARCFVVFVCTGNTCRSPMAQSICAKMLADHLGCTIEDLPGRGFVVHSAGLSAMMGREASEHALTVAREHGVDLSQHRSQPLTLDMLRNADHLFLMTRAHLMALTGLPDQVGPQPRLLSCDDADIVDPFGGDIDEYRRCARQIGECLERVLPLVLGGEQK